MKDNKAEAFIIGWARGKNGTVELSGDAKLERVRAFDWRMVEIEPDSQAFAKVLVDKNIKYDGL